MSNACRTSCCAVYLWFYNRKMKWPMAFMSKIYIPSKQSSVFNYTVINSCWRTLVMMWAQMALGTPAFKWFNYFPFLSFLFLSFFYILAHAALLKTSFSLAESDGHFSITLLCQQRHSCNLSKVFKTAFGVIDLHRQTNTDDMKAVFF